MIDSGAARTVISYPKLVASGQAHKFNIKRPEKKIKIACAIEEVTTEVIGEAEVLILLKGEKETTRKITHKVLVVSGLSHEAYLGNDFLTAGDNIITPDALYINPAPREKFNPPPNWIKINIQQKCKPKQCYIHSIEEITLAGGETKACKFTPPPHKLIDIEPLQGDIEAIPATVNIEGTPSLILTNPSENEITIKEGDKIATYTDAEEAYIATINTVEENITFRGIPDILRP